MIRTLFSLLLALAVVAEASAQTAPGTAAATKTTVHTKAATRRPAAKARRTTTHSTTVKSATAQPKAQPGTRNDIGPGGNGAVGSTESADGKGQSAYAAPGMPVNVDNPKKVGDYNGDPVGKPARSRRGTTLTPR